MTTEILKVVPVLPAQDIAATAAFYREKLGSLVDYEDPTYIMLHREGLALHFWHCPDRNIAENSSCYVYVRGIEALYAEYQAARVIHPNGPLEDKPCGMQEFTVLDLNGNAIRFLRNGSHRVV